LGHPAGAYLPSMSRAKQWQRTCPRPHGLLNLSSLLAPSTAIVNAAGQYVHPQQGEPSSTTVRILSMLDNANWSSRIATTICVALGNKVRRRPRCSGSFQHPPSSSEPYPTRPPRPLITIYSCLYTPILMHELRAVIHGHMLYGTG